MDAAIATLSSTSMFSFKDLGFLIEAEDPDVYEELCFQHAVNDGWSIVTSRADVLHTWLRDRPRQVQARDVPGLPCISVNTTPCW